MAGVFNNFFTADAIVAHEGAALTRFRRCKQLERHLQKLLNPRSRRLHARLAVLLVDERVERHGDNCGVDFLLNLGGKRRALFDAHLAPLLTQVSRLYIPASAYNQCIQAKSKQQKNVRFLTTLIASA